MDQLRVDIDVENCCIKVLNNGRGLPVEIHKEHNVYVPELVFGHLLTSDNYDDKEKKVTGGRNGYGAKLANIFSTKFVVQTADSSRGLKYKQVFESNMSGKREPKIDKYSGDDFTEVTFYPDLSRFGGMTSLDSDIVSLMTKRVYDIAGSIGETTKVYLNNKRLAVKGFKDYCELYLKAFNGSDGSSVSRVHEKVNGRWEIAVSLSDPKEGCGQFQQVSFVNSICTTKGGTHVNHVVDKFLPKLIEKVEAKNKGGMKVQPFHIKNHLWVFVNCLIENPSFDSQTKETLTTKTDQFGSVCAVSDSTLNKVVKMGVVEQVVSWIKSKQDQNINRLVKGGGGSGGNSRILGIPKLEDANDAGTRNSDKCTLILTEGDSAKALAVAGLGVVGRDKFGVFPLRGKLLNVREATYSQTVDNREIQALMRIVGLDPGKQYDSSLKGLRYGSIMLMTDQDHDGSHIKGLLINMIHYWWPSLCKLNGFLKEFVTPIVKVTSSRGGQVREFFTMVEYEEWKRANDDGRGFKVKYYKGLGTSTAKEAREYFSDMEKHRLGFKWSSDQDGECVDMAFNKKRSDDRKEWINGYEEGQCVDHRIKSLTYSDFINKELVQFSKYDVMRSIPSVVDGLKPGQRKVLFCAFKRNLRSDIKVAQFVGYVSEQSAYHHGEQSLESTIVGMAQDFVGSNNVNLLFPSGQFGTRLQGGKDAASGRYIYTRLCKHTRKLFSPHDDALLSYQTEEGQRIEPKWYCPIVPTVLINGADGIGTGWSTNVPSYDARDVIDNLRCLLRGHSLRDMTPAYRGFTGSVEPNGKGGFEFSGKISVNSDKTIEITELPVKVWTQNYKEFLQEMLEDYAKIAEKNAEKNKKGGKKVAKPKAAAAAPKRKKKTDSENVTPELSDDDRPAPQNTCGVQIKDFKEYHTEHFVHFKIELSSENLAKAESIGLEKVFKLKSNVGTSNMVLFDPNGKIRRYDTALEIIAEFAALRIELYGKRKSYLVSKLEREIEVIQNKVHFLLAVIRGDIRFANKKSAELMNDLKEIGIKSMVEIETAFKIHGLSQEEEEEEETDKGGYEYLLGMSMWNLTKEKVDALTEELHAKKDELAVLKKTSPESMWEADLVDLLVALDERDAEDWKDREAAKKKVMAKRLPVSRTSDEEDIPEILSDDSAADADRKISKNKYHMSGTIVSVDLKPLESKPQVWRKEVKKAAPAVKDEETKEFEVLSKAMGVAPRADGEGGGLLERLLKKRRESGEDKSQISMLDFVHKEPKLDTSVLKPPVTKRKETPISSAKKPARKRKDEESVLSSSEESWSSSSSSDDSSRVARKKRAASNSDSSAAPKRAPKRPAPKKVRKVKDSESEESSDSSVAPKKRPAAKKAVVYSDSSDEDSFVVSDEEDSDDSDYSSDD